MYSEAGRPNPEMLAACFKLVIPHVVQYSVYNEYCDSFTCFNCARWLSKTVLIMCMTTEHYPEDGLKN